MELWRKFLLTTAAGCAVGGVGSYFMQTILDMIRNQEQLLHGWEQQQGV